MAKFVIVFDDVLSSKLTKQTTVATATMECDNVVSFVENFNAISTKMSNRDGYTKTVTLDIKDGEIVGASLRYIAKEKH